MAAQALASANADPSIGPADSEGEFAGALTHACNTLDQQRQMLTRLGRDIGHSQFTEQTSQLVPAARTVDERERMRMLQLSLAEISKRQSLLLDAFSRGRREEMDSVALDAFVCAMHKIRTCLDVALGCSEEIAEMSAQPEVVHAGHETAKALRLIYHFTHELNDLASLRAVIRQDHLSGFLSGEVLAIAAGEVSNLAKDAGVELVYPLSGGFEVRGRKDLLRRSLSYIITMSIISPGVRKVVCEAQKAAGTMIEFNIRDNGHGTTLEGRAMAGSASALLDAATVESYPDASGFAVARRLVRVLGGVITVETFAGAGTRYILAVPQHSVT